MPPRRTACWRGAARAEARRYDDGFTDWGPRYFAPAIDSSRSAISAPRDAIRVDASFEWVALPEPTGEVSAGAGNAGRHRRNCAASR